MNNTQCIVLIASLAWSTLGYSQSTTVRIHDGNQVQTTSESSEQVLDLGNVKGRSKANVSASNILQAQSGTANRQALQGGQADGASSTDVTIEKSRQVQGGARNEQMLRIGQTEGQATSHVAVGTTSQTQA